jgi:hypothetical protein
MCLSGCPLNQGQFSALYDHVLAFVWVCHVAQLRQFDPFGPGPRLPGRDIAASERKRVASHVSSEETRPILSAYCISRSRATHRSLSFWRIRRDKPRRAGQGECGNAGSAGVVGD